MPQASILRGMGRGCIIDQTVLARFYRAAGREHAMPGNKWVTGGSGCAPSWPCASRRGGRLSIIVKIGRRLTKR